MIKDKQSYAMVVAIYRRLDDPHWTCEESKVEPLQEGETWNDREEWQIQDLPPDRVRIRAAFRVQPENGGYVALVPMSEAQNAADRAFRAERPGASLTSIERPKDTTLVEG